ncbi:MAG: lactonase family protein [Terriglobales bacterium]
MRTRRIYLLLFAAVSVAALLLSGCRGFFTAENGGDGPQPGTTARFAYVANIGATLGVVSLYTVDAATGVLTQNSQGVATVSNPVDLTIDAGGTLIYTASPLGAATGGLVEGYLVTRSGASAGTLQPASGSPFAGSELTQPSAIAVTPGATYLYVLNQAGQGTIPAAIAIFSIGTSGALTFVDNSQTVNTDALNSVQGITVDPSGRFVYAADGSSLRAYRIDTTTGKLTASGSAISITARSVVVDPQARFAYVAAENSGVVIYAINANSGALTQVGSVSLNTRTERVAMDPQGKFLFAVNPDASTVVGFAINADGTLTSAATANITNGTPTNAAIDPDGHFLYVTTDAGVAALGVVNQFRIASDGKLSFLGSVQANVGPEAIVVTK